ncbi:family 20 glycosylhydrolase [Carboxylicivirga mesophila]|uniref:beta-N-acetylhexosaminidase n=1 Tax=Carboxylicivirga mesophila TaxID=1166478 RepID=A0ABS5KF99_9BACT|nr:family 20 glycosylhydrolase [Carboxylicivirga mesophila]MBS2213656.1 family 20 glycosylhydrolase [Carboxylicivirga mesophila]
MKVINGFCILLILTLMACSTQSTHQSYNDGINVVPLPNQLVEQEGEFVLNSSSQWVVTGEEASAIVNFINSKVKQSTGFDLTIANEAPDNNYIAVELDESLPINEEGYSLSVSTEKVQLKAKTAQGVFYALQTLLQLLPAEIESPTLVKHVEWAIPAVEITDEPRFTWRGMHLDVCRHFVPVEDIKKHLDMLAMFKMNTFHWHLTEDQAWRIEIKKYPKLVEVGATRTEGEGFEHAGFYTQEEVKEIVTYAAERFITVVPEIELPGHALAALAAYPEYSCTGGPFEVRKVWGVEPDVYCAGKEATFHFLEDVIDEVVALFPSVYFHIGGDECPKERWKECTDCQKRMKQEGLADEHELQSYFVKRIEKVLIAHGKKMIGWDEILEGGLAESAAVMSWRGEKGGIEAASQGHDVVMTPGNWCYLDHYQGDYRVEPVAIGGYTTLEESYSYEPVPAELPEEKAKHVLGTQGNVWTEYMYTPELVEYRVYPRLIALAEVNWANKENKDYDGFATRINNQLVRMDQHGINYHIPLPEGPVNKVVFTDNTKLEFSNTRNYPMVYTTDGSEPLAYSNEYKQPLIFAENKTINIATLLPSGKMSKVRTITIEKTTMKPAVDVETGKVGLAEQYTEGTFIKVAELDKVTDWQTRDGFIENKGPKYRKSDYNDPSAHIYTGYLMIEEEGIYEFQTNLDQFFIAEELLINNDGEVKRFSRNNSTIALAKGKHPVKLVYLNNIIGGWPQAWNGPKVQYRLLGDEEFKVIDNTQYSY